VRREVRKYARARGVSQTQTERGILDNNMILGVIPSGVGGASPASVSLGSIIVEANMDEVNGLSRRKVSGYRCEREATASPRIVDWPAHDYGRAEGI